MLLSGLGRLGTCTYWNRTHLNNGGSSGIMPWCIRIFVYLMCLFLFMLFYQLFNSRYWHLIICAYWHFVSASRFPRWNDRDHRFLPDYDWPSSYCRVAQPSYSLGGMSDDEPPKVGHLCQYHIIWSGHCPWYCHYWSWVLYPVMYWFIVFNYFSCM